MSQNFVTGARMASALIQAAFPFYQPDNEGILRIVY